MEESAAKVLLVGECRELELDVVARLRQAVGARPAEVTVVAVVDKNRIVSWFAPLTGHVTIDQIRQEAEASATEAARLVASALPAAWTVRHAVASSWRDAMRSRSEYDLVHACGSCRSRRDRRHLLDVSAAGVAAA